LIFAAVLGAGCGLGDAFGDLVCTSFTLGTSDCESVPDGSIYPTGSVTYGEVAAFDLPTGNTDVLAARGHGTGEWFSWAYGIVVDVPNDRALVVDRATRAILPVDLVTGNRGGSISGSSRGAGTAFTGPGPLDLDATRNRAYVVDFGVSVVAVDLATGNRTTLAGPTAGSGPAVEPGWIAFDPVSDRVLVTDFDAQAVFAVDPETGERSLVSGATRGIGPVFQEPRQIALNPSDGVLYLIDSGEKALFEIDLATGDRSIVSPAGGSLPLDQPRLIVYDEAGARVLAADMGYDSLVSIDLATGNRTFLPGAPAVMTDIWGMALDKARSRLLLTRK
jgi:DNA-binding beta-propeller fold protein YncE